MALMAETPARVKVLIWDWPVRVCHGLIVLLIAAAWWTATHDQLQWHGRIGLTLLGVLVFRLLWGVVGGSTARFSSFVRGPATVVRYARSLRAKGPKALVVGHNPMGGWSVLAMLAAMAAQVTLGLFAVDTDGLESGPLADRVSFAAGRTAAHWHHVVFNGLLALIGLHLCAVLVYALRRDNLVRPMIFGRKAVSAGVEPMRPAAWWRALPVSGFAITLAVWVAGGCRV